MKFLELPWGEEVLASTMERLPRRRAYSLAGLSHYGSLSREHRAPRLRPDHTTLANVRTSSHCGSSTRPCVFNLRFTGLMAGITSPS